MRDDTPSGKFWGAAAHWWHTIFMTRDRLFTGEDTQPFLVAVALVSGLAAGLALKP
jgi:hypothetical protein